MADGTPPPTPRARRRDRARRGTGKRSRSSVPEVTGLAPAVSRPCGGRRLLVSGRSDDTPAEQTFCTRDPVVQLSVGTAGVVCARDVTIRPSPRRRRPGHRGIRGPVRDRPLLPDRCVGAWHHPARRPGGRGLDRGRPVLTTRRSPESGDRLPRRPVLTLRPKTGQRMSAAVISTSPKASTATRPPPVTSSGSLYPPAPVRRYTSTTPAARSTNHACGMPPWA